MYTACIFKIACKNILLCSSALLFGIISDYTPKTFSSHLSSFCPCLACIKVTDAFPASSNRRPSVTNESKPIQNQTNPEHYQQDMTQNSHYSFNIYKIYLGTEKNRTLVPGMSAVIQYETQQVLSECKVNITRCSKCIHVFSQISDLQKQKTLDSGNLLKPSGSLNEKAMQGHTITNPGSNPYNQASQISSEEINNIYLSISSV